MGSCLLPKPRSKAGWSLDLGKVLHWFGLTGQLGWLDLVDLNLCGKWGQLSVFTPSERYLLRAIHFWALRMATAHCK